MSVSKSREYLLLGDTLIEETARALHLTWNDEEMLCQDEHGDLIGWNTEMSLPINVDNIIQINFWGDGTLEFQLKDDEDSINWYDFDKEILIKVIKALRTIN